MSVNSIGTRSSLIVQSLVDMRAQLDDLQRQLGTGKKSATYAGIGLNRGLTVGLRAQLSAIGGYGDTISTVGTRISLAQTALGRMSAIGHGMKSTILQSAYDPDSNGQTTVQKTAQLELDELLGLLNTQIGDHYLFSGRNSGSPAVETLDHILNGDGARAGLKQMIAERKAADLGANGLGRLVIPAPVLSPIVGAGAAIAPDAQATGVGAATAGGNFLSSLGIADGDVITVTTASGVSSYTVGTAAATTVDTLNTALSTTGTAAVTASVTGGNLQIQSNNYLDSVAVSTTGADALVTAGLGVGNNSFTPTNLLTQGAVTAGQTLTVRIGSNPTLTIMFGPNIGAGEVSSIAGPNGLNAKLLALSGGSASVGANGNMTITATNMADTITIGGTATASNFGITPTTALPSNSAVISEDVAGSPFGFKLASVSSALTGAVATGPGGVPPVISVDLSAGNPNAGDNIQFQFTLPDGSSEKITLTATASSPPGANQFTIGGSAAATAANLRAALAGAVGKLATSSLAAASALAASNDFFNIDGANPPQRVDGPPYDSATSLIDGTAANTVTWYIGEAGSDPARSTAAARIDQSLSAAYGMRANEEGIRWMVQNVAALAATTFLPGDPDAAARSRSLNQRMITALDVPPGIQKIQTIQAELAGAQTSLKAAKDRHQQTSATLSDLLLSIEGVPQEQVGSQILALQTSLQASMRTTALLYQTSLVNFL